MNQRNNFNNRNKQPKKELVTFTLPVYKGANSNGRDYDISSLLNFLPNVSFDLVSVPLNCSKEIIFNEAGKRGVIQVGYIKGYDADAQTFDVVIFDKSTSVIEEMIKHNEEVVVYPRVIVNRANEVTYIIGLDVISI